MHQQTDEHFNSDGAEQKKERTGGKKKCHFQLWTPNPSEKKDRECEREREKSILVVNL